MNRLGTVVGFTFKNKVRTKSFVITTLLLALLMTIGIHVPFLIQLFTGGNDEGGDRIGLAASGEYTEIAQQIESYASGLPDSDVTFVRLDGTGDAAALKRQADDQDLAGYLEFEAGGEAGAFPAARYVSENGSIPANVQAVLQPALESAKTTFIAQDALSEAQIAQLMTPARLQASSYNEQTGASSGTGGASGGEDKLNPMNFITVYVLMTLFFFSAMLTGNMIASEVTSEKSSRVMEILITSVSPLTQMFGKVIGVFLVGLLQIAVFGATIAINLMLPYNRNVLSGFDLDFSQLPVDVLIYGLIFYILGYFLYALLYAAVGSIVSRTEDLGQAVTPLTMLSLAAFYIGIFSLSNPNSLLMKIASFVPFTSPTTMIARIGLGEIHLWEIAVSVVLLGAAIFFFGWLSAKIYRTGVLMYGKRPSFKELRKAMKAYKI
ncbi:ABC transporter permease [Saccharibacillus sp. CPCC 101409]|uniref:ABC transporter permease n=1 Tax=Saccharibacillus sp. CPCC 101409 TaxID=3058041 RepID=UPI0026741073|nr:ABC transporter permease [Saccharibacillus sp. CPCC 101409]MDO3412621.1 ABC transporter permease [Saccharibacillus sp. CPCC 101409]